MRVDRLILRIIPFLMVISPIGVVANPVTTEPWNGYPGAVTFTFDDACQSQLTNVVPELKKRGIAATFFLYNSGNAFTANKAAWVAAEKNGNELANHTLDHSDLTKATNAATEVSSMAALLRAADTSIPAVTLAYPGCAVGSESAVGSENFMARGCLFSAPYAPLQWKTQPSDWLNVDAIYVSDDATATGPTMTAIDAAKNGGWIATLNHGVGGDWLSVTPANVTAMFDRAIKDGLWIGTFQEVGAYWRASFAMDKATLSGSGPWTLTWTSPHPKMPKSVKLKVKLDTATFGRSFTVSQGSVAIPVNKDGSYSVEFMKLALSVAKNTGPTGVEVPLRSEAKEIRWSKSVLYAAGIESGRLLMVTSQGQRRILNVTGGQAYTGRLPAGTYFVRSLGESSEATQRFVVFP